MSNVLDKSLRNDIKVFDVKYKFFIAELFTFIINSMSLKSNVLIYTLMNIIQVV